MKVTPHFSVAEFGCRDGSPYPPAWIASRLRPLCEALEVLRTALGTSLRISSGFRSAAYNARIGGARHSQHVEGRAADVVADGASAAHVHATALRLYREGKLTVGGLGSYPSFTHLDVRPTSVRGALARWSGSRRSNET